MDTPDGPSFIAVIAVPEVGVGLVAQPHGGALRVGNPGNSGGGRAAAERRRARAERSEAVDDAMIGHVEKMSKIIAQLVEEARRRAIPVSAVRQFRAEGERPLKVPSPPAPTAVFTGVGGRAGGGARSTVILQFARNFF